MPYVFKISHYAVTHLSTLHWSIWHCSNMVLLQSCVFSEIITVFEVRRILLLEYNLSDLLIKRIQYLCTFCFFKYPKWNYNACFPLGLLHSCCKLQGVQCSSQMLRTAVSVVSLLVIKFSVKWTASTAEVICKVAESCWVF